MKPVGIWLQNSSKIGSLDCVYVPLRLIQTCSIFKCHKFFTNLKRVLLQIPDPTSWCLLSLVQCRYKFWLNNIGLSPSRSGNKKSGLTIDLCWVLQIECNPLMDFSRILFRKSRVYIMEYLCQVWCGMIDSY